MPAPSAGPSISMSPPDSPVGNPRCGRISPGDWPGLIARTEGTQLVIGGPGTGKTELLARRAAHLINSGIARSDEVLALTFSRETASDLRGRITSGARRSFGEMSVGTFHGFARAVVEEHCQMLLGGTRPPMVLTTPEQIQFVKETLDRESPEDWPLLYRRMLKTRTLAEELADFMLRCGERRVTPEELAAQARTRPAWAALPGFYQRYLQRLREAGKTDYTGLLLLTNRALGVTDIGERTAARFPYVLADELQEATVVQTEILKKLVTHGCHLTAVADPDQTSFFFRGAERASVQSFPSAFAAAGNTPPRVFRLDTSFRVPAEVLAPAGELFASDPHLPTPASHSGRVDLYLFDQETTEHDWIAGEIKRLRLVDRVPYPEIAVLTRTSRLLAGLSRALDRERIPHTRPGARLIDHPAVRMVLDLAWAAAVDVPDPQRHPEWFTVAVDRTVESALLGPLFSLTQGRVAELSRTRRRDGQRWAEVLSEKLPEARGLTRLLGDSSWATDASATEGFWRLWRAVPQFTEIVESDRLSDYRSALASFAQTLGRLAERSPETSLLDYRNLTLEGDLEASPLLPSHNPEEGRVTISTIHQAKGRQFELVFIAGATEGVFPDTRPYHSLLEGQFLSRPDLDHFGLVQLQLEEERSLAYTAMTRASRRVVWTTTSPDLNEARRTVSRFVFSLADRSGQPLAAPAGRPASSPVGRLETESYLRRTQRDISETLPRRLAAAALLARPGRPDLWDPRGFAGVRPPGPDTGLIRPGHVMSASQAEAYQKCPRRYALESRLRLDPSDDNPYLRFGSLMHSVLEKSVRRSSEREVRGLDLPEALQELSVRLAEMDFGTPVLNYAWLERGTRLLEHLERRWTADGGRAIGFEERIRVDLDGIEWRGRIDRVDRMEDGTLRIVDYKTSKNPMAVKDAAVSLQLGFYLWARSGRGPDADRVSAAELWFPLCDRETSWTRSFDPANLDEVLGELREIAEAILAERADPLPWPPRPSRECGRCRVRSLCPAWPEGQGAFAS
ncbi:MAG: ATP-dependent DNA helicase [bacterium]|nr:ATP-dependent DNA helicase [bacterium]MDE0602200.1 ATP-dependent DNA helicase [bacterium]